MSDPLIPRPIELIAMTGIGIQAENIVDAIIADLKDRKGLRHEWDQIDNDDTPDV